MKYYFREEVKKNMTLQTNRNIVIDKSISD